MTFFKPLIIGAVLFSLLFTGVQMVLEDKLKSAIPGGDLQKLEKIEELTKRMQGGDAKAMEELMAEFEGMGFVDDSGEVSEEAMANIFRGVAMDMAPAFIGFMAIMVFLGIIAGLYYLIVIIDKQQDAFTAFKRIPKLILPMIGVTVWTFIRSFVWVPIAGILLAVYLVPRLVLSSVVLVSEESGVFESVNISWRRTRGYWWKIFLNLVLLGICLGIASVLISASVALVTASVPVITVLIMQIVSQLATAFGMIFLLRLALTLKAHPRT